MPQERQGIHPQHVINYLIAGRASWGAHKVATQHIQRYMALPDGRGSALDIPCGTGYGCAILHAKGWQATGVDRDARSIKNATAAYASSRFIRADAEAWAPGQVYDLGVCLEGLEHLRDPDAMVKRMAGWARQWFISIPLRSKHEFHLTEFASLADVRALLEQGFRRAEFVDPPRFWRCWGAR